MNANVSVIMQNSDLSSMREFEWELKEFDAYGKRMQVWICEPCCEWIL